MIVGGVKLAAVEGYGNPSKPEKPNQESETTKSQAITPRQAAFKAACLDAVKLTCDLTEKEGIKLGWTLSELDLMIAVKNAYCPLTNFAIPQIPPRRGHPFPPNVLLVTKDSDPIFYTHFLITMLRNADPHMRANLKQVREQEMFSADLQTFKEYIDTLQETARLFHKYPDRYIDRTAEIVASITASHGALGALPPMLFIKDRTPTTISFGSSCTKETFTVPLNMGDVMFIPGAGYNALAEIPSLLCLPYNTTVLNDSNKFVEKVLSRTCKLLDAEHISVVGGDFGKVELPDSIVSIMVLGLIHSAGENAINDLLQNAKVFMKTGGQIICINPTEAKNKGDVDEATLVKLLQDSGFAVTQKTRYQYELMGFGVKAGDPYHFELTADELLNKQFDRFASIPKSKATFIRAEMLWLITFLVFMF